jgi:hypothetical protein
MPGASKNCLQSGYPLIPELLPRRHAAVRLLVVLAGIAIFESEHHSAQERVEVSFSRFESASARSASY